MSRSRRAPGDGSIYQRADGRWEASISMGWGPGGKRRRRKVVAKTRAGAKARLADLQKALDDGLSLDASKMTLTRWLTVWLDDHVKLSVRPRTFATYRQITIQHLIPSLGHRKLRDLSASDVQRYLNEKAKNLSPKTVSHHHAVLRRALRRAEEFGFVGRNVARLVTPPKQVRHQVSPLSAAEARQFLDALEGHRLRPLYVLGMASGMRRAELLGVTWEAVHLEAGTVRVERSLMRYDREHHLDEVKTLASRRTLALPAPVVAALRAQRARQAAERLASEVWLNDWDLVFTDRVGRPLEGTYVTAEFQRILEAAGVRRVRLHDLRHGVATFMLACGVPLKAIQTYLGHSTYQITADTYAHMLPQMERDAAERVGTLLFGAV